MGKKEYLRSWAEAYKDDLTNSIMPFWLNHGWDKENGGIYTRLDRDGSLMNATKSVWFQGRWAFICTFAYNSIEENQEWLEASKSVIDLIEKHCFDEDGHMYFGVTIEGKPPRKRRHIFSETFAVIAFAEYSLATGDKHHAERALQVSHDAQRFLSTPGFLPAKYEAGVETQNYSIIMILINVGSHLRVVIGDPTLAQQIDGPILSLRHYFMHPEFKALLETVGPKGEFTDTSTTHTINPGHCIKTAWFIMEEAKLRDWDKDLLDTVLTIFGWSWDWGRDKQYGDIINFRDCRNLPPQDYSQDMKFWWPQCETIIASLYAYLGTGDEEYFHHHQRISEWTYAHLPDQDYPEWYGYLHRDGTVAQPTKDNIFKDLFHAPHMMIKGYMLYQEILKIME